MQGRRHAERDRQIRQTIRRTLMRARKDGHRWQKTQNDRRAHGRRIKVWWVMAETREAQEASARAIHDMLADALRDEPGVTTGLHQNLRGGLDVTVHVRLDG